MSVVRARCLDVTVKLLLNILGVAVGFFLVSAVILSESSSYFEVAQGGFSSWRPYSNPDRLISVGMNKGEVLAIAGKPDHQESYYQSAGRGRLRISDWYYVPYGHDPATTLLKFVGESLVSINSTPTR